MFHLDLKQLSFSVLHNVETSENDFDIDETYRGQIKKIIL
jgi:hypothetical protein